MFRAVSSCGPVTRIRPPRTVTSACRSSASPCFWSTAAIKVRRSRTGTSGNRTKPACTAPPTYTSLPKSPVERDQNPALRGGPFEQRTIAWIGFFSRVEDVVTLGAQPFGEPSACAVVDEELHRFVTETAASVSSAIAACA